MSGRVRVSLIVATAVLGLTAGILPIATSAADVQPASALDGFLTLGFSPEVSSPGFRFYPAPTRDTNGTPIALGTAQSSYQGLSVSGSCKVGTPLSSGAGSTKLVDVKTFVNVPDTLDAHATPYPSSPAAAADIGARIPNGSLIGLGTKPKSGSGASGTPCGQVNYPGETLVLSIKDSLPGYTIDEADLDIEAKFGTTINADVYLNGSKTGSVQKTDSLVDSGPNCSGCNNWSVAIKDKGDFDTIVLWPSLGPNGNPNNAAFSLEGGQGNPCIGSATPTDCRSDSTNTDPRASDGLRKQLNTRQSVFHVTIPTSGPPLNCGDKSVPASDDNGTTATVQREDNAGGGCGDLIDYSLTATLNSDGTTTVSFRKDLGGQDAQFLMTIDWKPEDRTYPNTKATQITYDGTTFHNLQWCTGTGTSPVLYGLPGVETWCLVSHDEELNGEAPNGKIQVTEVLYGRGDPGLKR